MMRYEGWLILSPNGHNLIVCKDKPPLHWSFKDLEILHTGLIIPQSVAVDIFGSGIIQKAKEKPVHIYLEGLMI